LRDEAIEKVKEKLKAEIVITEYVQQAVEEVFNREAQDLGQSVFDAVLKAVRGR
jgi:hypothetical protein